MGSRMDLKRGPLLFVLICLSERVLASIRSQICPCIFSCTGPPNQLSYPAPLDRPRILPAFVQMHNTTRLATVDIDPSIVVRWPKRTIKPRLLTDQAEISENDCANSDCEDPKRQSEMVDCSGLGCLKGAYTFHRTCLPTRVEEGGWIYAVRIAAFVAKDVAHSEKCSFSLNFPHQNTIYLIYYYIEAKFPNLGVHSPLTTYKIE